jgi:hypothetical protein
MRTKIGGKAPTQMGETLAAKHDLPGMTGKPGEIG